MNIDVLGKFALMGANSVHYGITPIYMGGNNKNDRVASPESISIHLKQIMVKV